MAASDPVPLEERLTSVFGQEKYRARLREAAARRRHSITVDFSDIMAFDGEFARELLEHPRAMLAVLDRACRRQLQVEDLEYSRSPAGLSFRARVAGLPEALRVSDLRAEHLRKLVMVDGLVARVSSVAAALREGMFRCRYCGTQQLVPQAGEGLTQPGSCGDRTCRGSRRPSFELVPEESVYADRQTIGLQDKPEDLPPGRMPRSVEVVAEDDLVDSVRPGDRALVVGILDTTRGRGREFSMSLEAVSIEPVSKEPQAVHVTPDEEAAFRRMSGEPDMYRRLVASVAPSIYGLEHIKEAVLLLLLGGVSKTFPDGLRVRGDLNVLLVGDPGTAKSQLLQYAALIAPRGVYTSGRGSTAAGLTAAVLREKEGGMVLEAGAMVLADMGVCCIDEIDKMRPEDRVAIHEAMAQQTVSVAKGGIVATLNARTAVLAAANPAFGRYDQYRNFAENVSLPITILSRFDLIFVLRDEPAPDRDRQVASHISSLHRLREPLRPPPIPPETLRKYVAYAKRVEPVVSDGALRVLEDFYLRMRAVYERTKTVSITARQFESLIRLTEARARALLKPVADEQDAAAAVLLMRRSLQEVGVDVETGVPDIDSVMSGKPRSLQEKIKLVIDTIREIEEGSGFASDYELRRRLLEAGMKEEELERILSRLLVEGRIYTPRSGVYKLT
jgi:replicative DNA helicase Mcm